MLDGLRAIAEGRYEIEERHMLCSAIWREGVEVAKGFALNDAVVGKNGGTRLISLSLKINNSEKDSRYWADGLIFSTATGSTAYSLSAGGPIVHPSLPVTIITPVCPHALDSRPLVIPGASVIEVRSRPQGGEITLANDGVPLGAVLQGDVVRISGHARKARFIKLPGKPSYYDSWQERLRRGDKD
jgi:NAD+ kinase